MHVFIKSFNIELVLFRGDRFKCSTSRLMKSSEHSVMDERQKQTDDIVTVSGGSSVKNLRVGTQQNHQILSVTGFPHAINQSISDGCTKNEPSENANCSTSGSTQQVQFLAHL